MISMFLIGPFVELLCVILRYSMYSTKPQIFCYLTWTVLLADLSFLWHLYLQYLSREARVTTCYMYKAYSLKEKPFKHETFITEQLHNTVHILLVVLHIMVFLGLPHLFAISVMLPSPLRYWGGILIIIVTLPYFLLTSFGR